MTFRCAKRQASSRSATRAGTIQGHEALSSNRPLFFALTHDGMGSVSLSYKRLSQKNRWIG